MKNGFQARLYLFDCLCVKISAKAYLFVHHAKAYETMLQIRSNIFNLAEIGKTIFSQIRWKAGPVQNFNYVRGSPCLILCERHTFFKKITYT